MSASTDLAERLFAELARETADPPGVTRAAYGEGEQFAHDLMRREAAGLEHGVQVELGTAFTWTTAAMSQDLIAKLEESANVAGVPTLRMPSGAGHDAAVMAQAGIPTAMLFVRNENGSHNPHEAMEVSDLDQAVQVLSQYVRGAHPQEHA